MEKSEKYRLDFSLTYPYIKKHLGAGKTLSHSILKNCDFNLGTFYTILPKNSNLNAIYRFKSGGIISQEKEKKLIEFYGSQRWYQEITSTEDEMIEYVYNYLKRNNNATVVVEDVIRDRGNKFTKINNISLSYMNNEVYYILKSKNSYKEISDPLRQTVEVWHFLAILIPRHIELLEDLTDDQINLLSSSIQCMIVVAYDKESYIFWEKN